MTDRFATAKAIADTVLYEGYLLYPYRASAAKNQARWQFGVLMPPGFASPDRGEYDTCQCECLAEPGKDAEIDVLVRFLRLQQRTAQALRADGDYEDVHSLYAAEGEITTWVEAVAEEVSLRIPVADLVAADSTTALDLPAGEDSELLRSAEGALVGRVVRSRAALSGELRLHADELDGPFGGLKIHAEIHNTTPWSHPNPYRDAALHAAFVATHALIGVSSGTFLSLLDPPEWAKVAVGECTNVRCWPVLLGAGDAVMASPIILYDFPTIAPESPADLFDGTEIDEILTLRTMAMTDEEKRQARATDPRARALVDRVDSMPGELLERLHGTVRYLRGMSGEPDAPIELHELTDDDPTLDGGRELDPGEAFKTEAPWWNPEADSSVDPDTDAVVISGVEVRRGSKVVLRPGARRTDAQDMFLDEMVATVQAVVLDVDGEQYLAVSLDDDPAADLQTSHGRFRYFFPDEVEPYVPAGNTVQEPPR